ncbi:Photosystem I PsaA/PsaB protein [Raphanus sativus]|nr:Photosystem I PsaA/PsaB protein [Raphanus sativus]
MSITVFDDKGPCDKLRTRSCALAIESALTVLEEVAIESISCERVGCCKKKGFGSICRKKEPIHQGNSILCGRGYWQELIESIVWAHNKLKVAPATQPRALSIVQGRAVGVTHYLLGGIATTWAFFLARIIAVG